MRQTNVCINRVFYGTLVPWGLRQPLVLMIKVCDGNEKKNKNDGRFIQVY